jgi:hypothetical protein
MAARHWLTLNVALCGALAMTGVEAAAKTRAAAQPVYRGCTHFVAPLCMGLTSRGTTYALFGAFIPPGTGADVYGTVSGTGPCGPTLQVTTWKQNKLRCAR